MLRQLSTYISCYIRKNVKQTEAKMYETIQGHIKYSSNNKETDPASDCRDAPPLCLREQISQCANTKWLW